MVTANSLNIQQPGMMAFDGTATFFGRTLMPGAGITITNGNGIAGNPVITLTGGGTAVETLTDDVGTVINPLANNIQLVGHVVEQGATKFSTIVAGANLANINPMSPARWIVDTLGFNGTHTTMTAATASATAGDTILILPGTYTENWSAKAGVNYVAYSSDGISGNVILKGKITCNFAGTAYFGGVEFQSNAGSCLDFTGASACSVTVKSCNFVVEGGQSFITANNSLASFFAYECEASLAGAIYTVTNGLAFAFQNCNIGFTQTSALAAGLVQTQWGSFDGPLTVSGSAAIVAYYTVFAAANTTTVTLSGTSVLTAYECLFSGGSASAVSIGSGCTASLYSGIIVSSNTNAITGAGSINYANLTFSSTSTTTNTTTQVPFVVSNNAVNVVTPGAYPYTTVPQDAVILVDSSVARTITPLAAPTKGQMHRIKDNGGTAAAHNITVTPSGKNIDGAASYVINVNYGSIDIVYNGTQWNVL